jgi:hypothetical protein
MAECGAANLNPRALPQPAPWQTEGFEDDLLSVPPSSPISGRNPRSAPSSDTIEDEEADSATGGAMGQFSVTIGLLFLAGAPFFFV